MTVASGIWPAGVLLAPAVAPPVCPVKIGGTPGSTGAGRKADCSRPTVGQLVLLCLTEGETARQHVHQRQALGSTSD